MDRVDALITAGGKGTRMCGVPDEKPLMPLLGKPMVDWVAEALRSSAMVGMVYASVSDNAPRTREHLRSAGIEVVETSGKGYVADLGQAMRHIRGRDVLICPADMPLITTKGVEDVIDHYRRSGVASLSVAVPSDIVRSLGAVPSFTLQVEGREVVLGGVSIVERERILTEEMLSQGYAVFEDEQFALNVNTPEELRTVERLLAEREKRSRG